MKNLTSTTTGTISSQMILDHCGDYAGKFQDEAFDIFAKVSGRSSFDMTTELCERAEHEPNSWADIMYDRRGNVYAIWAEDSLTCQNADAMYIQIDREDCEAAFVGMEEKI